jgi:hypothetical protein
MPTKELGSQACATTQLDVHFIVELRSLRMPLHMLCSKKEFQKKRKKINKYNKIRKIEINR